METTNLCPECQSVPGSSTHKCACCRAYEQGWASARRGRLIPGVLVAVLLSIALLATLRPAEPRPALSFSPGVLAGAWTGTWSTPEGYLYDGMLEVAPDLHGALDTRILWTLRRSPRADEQAKLGLSGYELVRGSWDGRLVHLQGYGVIDENRILGQDTYRLVLSDDGNTLGGMTRDHGTWNGACFFKRVR